MRTMSDFSNPVALTARAFDARFTSIRFLIGLASTILTALGITATVTASIPWMYLVTALLLVVTIGLGCRCLAFEASEWEAAAELQARKMNATGSSVQVRHHTAPYLRGWQLKRVRWFHGLFIGSMMAFVIAIATAAGGAG
jgi:hypothetical protein